MFSLLRDFCKFGHAAADFCSQEETEIVGNVVEGGKFKDISMSQSTIQGGANSNMHPATEDMDDGAEAATYCSTRPHH